MIKEQTMTGLGLMSGSSLDGVDMAVCSLKYRYDEATNTLQSVSIDLREHDCIPFPESIKQRLIKADALSVSEFIELDKDLGVFFGKRVFEFIRQKSIEGVEFVASHGHTILHEPAKGYSCQIGSPSHIAANSGILTIGDFRNMDMAYGGEGAPMAPLIDRYIYPNVDIFLNIGGIANVGYSFDGTTFGYDLAPANQFFNKLAGELGFDYDDQGRLASKGQVNPNLLGHLEALDYFSKSGPKSLDNLDIREHIWPSIKSSVVSVEDKLATCVQLLVNQFEKALKHFLSLQKAKSQVSLLISGGGAKNIFLVEQLLDLQIDKVQINRYETSESFSDMKEAMLMALAGGLRILELPNILSSVTGAKKDSIGGGVFYP